RQSGRPRRPWGGDEGAAARQTADRGHRRPADHLSRAPHTTGSGDTRRVVGGHALPAVHGATARREPWRGDPHGVRVGGRSGWVGRLRQGPPARWHGGVRGTRSGRGRSGGGDPRSAGAGGTVRLTDSVPDAEGPAGRVPAP